MITLLNCPFCGGEPKRFNSYQPAKQMWGGPTYVYCSKNLGHRGGDGCNLGSAQKNNDGKCDYCHELNIPCIIADKEWNKRK